MLWRSAIQPVEASPLILVLDLAAQRKKLSDYPQVNW
jgi:hypothetical protein